MVRRGAIGLGGFLLLLWVMALAQQGSTTWLTYSVGTCSILALGVAKLVPFSARTLRAFAWPALLSAILLAMAAAGFATGATRWLRWWTLIVGLAFGGLAMSAPALPWLRAQRI